MLPRRRAVRTCIGQARGFFGDAATASASLVRHVDAWRSIHPANKFTAKSVDLGWGRVYGGQTMAQAVAACQHTAGPSRVMHHFSCHFLAGGSVSHDVDIEVSELASGRSFSFVHARALQAGKPILAMTASLQTPEPGMVHQRALGGRTLDPTWRTPHELPSMSEHMAPLMDRLPNARMRAIYSRESPVEMRPVEFVASWESAPRPPRRALWFRVRGALPDELSVHQRLLAYISDWGLLETALYPHDAALWSKEVRTASLTHAMHFHQPFRCDEWLCHVMESPSSSGARGFATGEIWSEGGVLVASTSQEGLIRRLAAPKAVGPQG